VDDLNDWVGAFAGNPQTVTPHLDRMVATGAVVFQRAYCPGPVCGPARSAMLSGFMPHRTGVYNNQHNMLRADLVRTYATLPEYFGRHGYHTVSSGKIFHKHFGTQTDTTDEGQWAFHEWLREGGIDKVNPAEHYSRGEGLLGGKPDPSGEFRTSAGSEFEWGPLQGAAEDMKDLRTARWAAERLAQLRTDKPFFLAVGISQPHLPWIVPQEYFDRHPLESICIPEHRLDDLDDIVTPAGRAKFGPSEDYQWVRRDPELFRRAVQAYLAATSFADECVGRILEALEKSPHRDNTIVVVFGDHGWHLGEKLRFRKATLWAEATRLPLLVRLPGMTARQDCPRVVNLIDLYPTLVELCGLPPKLAGSLDGRSLAPLLREPARAWPHPTLVIDPQGKGAAVISEDWYYVDHGDGTREFYDMRSDPLQWTNLAQSEEPRIAAERDRLAALFPTSFAPPVASDPRGPKRGTPDPSLRTMRENLALH
jgi:arylsulfatase A-like enzyme